MASPSEIAALEIRITGVEKAISQFSNFQQTTTKTMSASEAAVTRSLKNMVSQFVGVAAAARAVQNVVSSGIGFNQFVENTTTSFTVMMKSAEKAKAQMKDLYDFAVNSPLTFKETAASSKQLMAYGFTAEELIPTMKTLGSVAIATGHSLDDISYVYGTLKSQGRAYSRDLMQFGMRGIPIYEELAKVMGADVKQIQKMASEGKIGFAEVEKAFENMTTGSGRFSGVIEGYMTTLTGKLSMLSDVAQQSAGTLMSGVTKEIGNAVSDLTKKLSSSKYQAWIKDLSTELQQVAKIIRVILGVVVDNLPLITAALKLWVASKIFSLLGTVPSLLAKIALGANTASDSMLSLLMNGKMSLFTAFTGGIDGVIASLQRLALMAKAMIVSNPLVAVLAAAVVAGLALRKVMSDIYADAAEKGRTSSSEKDRTSQLAFDYDPVRQAGFGKTFLSSISGGLYKIENQINPDQVAAIAESYNLTTAAAAKTLIATKALDAAEWSLYQTGLLESKRAERGPTEIPINAKQAEIDAAKYMAGINNNPDFKHFLINIIDPQTKQATEELEAAGTRGAREYVAGIDNTIAANKNMWGRFYDTDKQQADIETAIKSLEAVWQGGKGNEAGLIDTGYFNIIGAALDRYKAQLDGLGKKSKTISKEFKELGTWWTPLEYAAKRTASQMDDIGVSTDKTLENATKEYNTRMEAYRVDLLITSNAEEQAKLIAARNKDTIAYKKLLQDITEEGIKQKNLASYNQVVSGNAEYWENMQASAGAMYSSGNLVGGAGTQFRTQMLQGTEVGNIQSSGMGIAGVVGQAVTAFATMISSIENVGKVLNPFATMFESTKEILEPLLNNALKPLVQILEQVGTVLGKILAPFIGLIKIITVVVYAALTPFMAILQIVANGFMWFYDTIIVRVGNAFIGLVNAIIGAINGALGWLGVNIQYIDALETSTEAMKDFAKIIDSMKNSLDQTIDYLTDKINDAVDKQLASLQDLYEVGAITATDYEKQAKGLDAQKIKTDDVLVSAMDKAITSTAEMYNRLGELYNLKDTLTNTDGLTEKQQVKLLKDAGLSDINLETAMTRAVYAALSTYKTAKTNTTIQNKIDASQKAVDEAKAQIQRYTNAVFNDQMALYLSSGLNFGAWSDKASHEAELQKWKAAYAKAVAELETLKSSGSFAVGTSYVPQDMTANIHKGEGIVPATFMDSIRSGELTLSGGGNEGSGQAVNVYVNVEGSVQTENNLAASIARNIRVQRKQGLLTV